MPTQQTTYNSRITDEALEKRFRDTFRSQGGAELVDDLYAQGVIVPVVDFTQAATGEVLAENLQTAWDFTTGSNQINNADALLISNAGFWLVDLTCTLDPEGASAAVRARIYLDDGVTEKSVWGISSFTVSGGKDVSAVTDTKFVVFLRSGDQLRAQSTTAACSLDVWYRQIATVNGDLVNPSGFTSS